MRVWVRPRHVISEFLIFALALTFAEYLGDYISPSPSASRSSILPSRPCPFRLKDGLKAAAKADVMSLTAFEIGLFGWMAVMAFVLFPAPDQLMPNSAAFWFLMQVGMIIGFFFLLAGQRLAGEPGHQGPHVGELPDPRPAPRPS